MQTSNGAHLGSSNVCRKDSLCRHMLISRCNEESCISLNLVLKQGQRGTIWHRLTEPTNRGIN